jgi:hypothetical protein
MAVRIEAHGARANHLAKGSGLPVDVNEPRPRIGHASIEDGHFDVLGSKALTDEGAEWVVDEDVGGMKEMGHRSLARLEGVFFGFFFILDCGFNLLIVFCDPLVVVLCVEGNGGVVGFVLRGVEVLISRRRLIVFICILRTGLEEDDLSLKGIL